MPMHRVSQAKIDQGYYMAARTCEISLECLSNWVCETSNRLLRHSLMKLLHVEHGFVVFVPC